MTVVVLIYPDGCSRTLPLEEARSIMAARGDRDGLQLGAVTTPYAYPSELDRRPGGPRGRAPFIERLTEEQRQGVVATVLRTSYRTAAKVYGVSKFTIRRVMKRQGVSKRAVRAAVKSVGLEGAQA